MSLRCLLLEEVVEVEEMKVIKVIKEIAEMKCRWYLY
jgi:hypothetical protein